MPSKTNDRPIDIYVRVSRVNDRDVEAEGGTASEQERRCRAQLEADGLTPGKVFLDTDESGGKSSRPDFDKMLARIDSGTSGGVICLNLKRFGRRSKFAQQIIDIHEAGARFISCQEKIDTSTPSGRFMLRVFLSIAEMELEQLTEGWRSVQSNAIGRGVHIGPPPAGYDVSFTPHPKTGKPIRGPLVPNEYAPIVTEAFAMKARGASQSAVARHLNAIPLPERIVRKAKNGHEVGDVLQSEAWSTNAAKKLLQNRTYLGFVRSGELEEKAHEPLVTEPVFRTVQALFEHRGPARKQQKALLSGILRCGTCGHGMVRDYTVKPSGKKYFFYRCRNTGPCSSRASVGAEAAERYVISKTVVDEANPHTPDVTIELRAALELAQANLATFQAAWLEQGLSPVDAIQMRAPLVQAVADAEQALEAAIPVEEDDELAGLVVPAELADKAKAVATARKVLRAAFPDGITVAPGRSPLEGRLFF